MHKHRLCSGVALGAAALVVAGCGSYTKKDFAAQANAICSHTLQQLRALPAPAQAGGERAQLLALGDYLTRAAPLVTAEAAKLAKLQRPAGTDAQRRLLTAYLAAERQTAVAYAALARAAATGSPAAVSAAGVRLRSSPAVAYAAQYGLAVCASPGATIAGAGR
jgi:hypothetical protein